MTAQQIINRLKEGNSRFVSDNLSNDLQHGEKRLMLTASQSPYAIILSCADSRVIPELVFDTGLGELFVIRVAGNVASRSSVASIEYAVAVLKTKVIVVLGHQSCGAVAAAIAGGDYGKNLNYLLAFIGPSLEASGVNASEEEVVRQNALLTAKDLVRNSEIIENAVKSGEVEIASAYYHLETGAVDFL